MKSLYKGCLVICWKWSLCTVLYADTAPLREPILLSESKIEKADEIFSFRVLEEDMESRGIPIPGEDAVQISDRISLLRKGPVGPELEVGGWWWIGRSAQSSAQVVSDGDMFWILMTTRLRTALYEMPAFRPGNPKLNYVDEVEFKKAIENGTRKPTQVKRILVSAAVREPGFSDVKMTLNNGVLSFLYRAYDDAMTITYDPKTEQWGVPEPVLVEPHGAIAPPTEVPIFHVVASPTTSPKQESSEPLPSLANPPANIPEPISIKPTVSPTMEPPPPASVARWWIMAAVGLGLVIFLVGRRGSRSQ